MSNWKCVARLTQKKGLQGRFVAQACHDLPFLLEEGMNVFVVPPHLDLPRTLMVARIEDVRGCSACIRFKEEIDASKAALLCERFLLVEKAALNLDKSEVSLEELLVSNRVPESVSSLELAEALRGVCVLDEDLGELGCIVDVQGTTFQKCLCVELSSDCRARLTDDAQENNHTRICLIPLVDAFVRAIDLDEARILVTVPESLIRLAL